MNLLQIIDILGGGQGSGCNPRVAKCGRKGTGKSLEKQKRALSTYKPTTSEDFKMSAAIQNKVAQTLGGQSISGWKPFDVIVGKIGIEVKTFTKNTNDKITMHKASLARKLRDAKRLKLKATYTILFDYRGGANKLYFKKGLGSFRLQKMEATDWDSLKEKIK